jgi:diaminopimelate epimerase
MKRRFVDGAKLQAYGNDFIVVSPGAVAAEQMKDFACRVCDPHLGIGADGCVYIAHRDSNSFALRIFNRDGSEAAMSGNGVRCAAAYLHLSGERSEELAFLTPSGLKRYRLIESKGLWWRYESWMGQPDFRPSRIPFEGCDDGTRVQDLTIRAADSQLRIWALSVGNPQCVVFLENLPCRSELEALGSSLGRHPHFPEGTNVSFVRVKGKQVIEIRIWERGVGPTSSSGTGCCGAAVASLEAGRVRSPVTVETEVGSQVVSWHPGEEICLRGEVALIAQLQVIADDHLLE